MSSKRYRTCITNPYICPDDTACQSPNITINTVGSSGSIGPTGPTGAPGKDGTIPNGDLTLHSLSFGSLDPKSTDPKRIVINPNPEGNGIQIFRNVLTNQNSLFTLDELAQQTLPSLTNPLALTINVNDVAGNIMTVEDGLSVSLPVTNGITGNFQYLTTEYFSGVTGYFTNLIVDNLTASGFEGGKTGPAGPTGPTGYMGSDGKEGKAGKDGDIGPTGYTGYTGPAGQDGSGILDGKIDANTAIFSDMTTGNPNVWINVNTMAPTTDISDGFIKVGGNSKGMIDTDGLIVNYATDLYGKVVISGDISGNTASFNSINTSYISGSSGHFTYLSADNMDTSNTNLFPNKNGLISMGYDSVNTIPQLRQLRKSADTINSIYIGNDAGSKSFGSQAINIGMNAGFEKQDDNSISIGSYCGQTNQTSYCIAMGVGSGNIKQGLGVSTDISGYSTAIGFNAGGDSQKGYSVAIGPYAGSAGQGTSSVAIGYNSALKTQGDKAISIGTSAGSITQGTSSVAIGNNSALKNQNNYAIAIGDSAGSDTQGANAIAIGYNAGSTKQATDAIAIGSQCALTNQLEGGITIGSSACPNGQGEHSIAIGHFACPAGQGNKTINIGYKSGERSGNIIATPADESITIGNLSLNEGIGCSIYGSSNHIDNNCKKSTIIGNNCTLAKCNNCSLINCDTTMIVNGTNITMISTNDRTYDNGLLNQSDVCFINNHPIGFVLKETIPTHTLIDPANNPDLKLPVTLYSLDIPYGGVWEIVCNINIKNIQGYTLPNVLVYSILVNYPDDKDIVMDNNNLYVSNSSIYQFSRKIKLPGVGPYVVNNVKIVVNEPTTFAFELDTTSSYLEVICSA